MRNLESDSRILAIGRGQAVVLIVVLILAIGIGVYGALDFRVKTTITTSTTALISSEITQQTSTVPTSSLSSSSATSTTSSSSSLSQTSTSSNTEITTTETASNSSFTWETSISPIDLDPNAGSGGPGTDQLQGNVYESLLWYNGTNTGYTLPWLAQNWTASANLQTYNFTLRQGIRFADGEPLNSTSVYFSINRVLVRDGSLPTAHGANQGWILQQLFNKSLSTFFSGISQQYNAQYVNEILAENAVQITGPYTFTIHVQNPNPAFQYIFGGLWSDIIAPVYTMQQDIKVWSTPSDGYLLPYSQLSGNLTNMIQQYFDDEAATCNAGVTPSGCASTYLDGSYQGSLAGSGPYEMVSYSASTSNIVLKTNPYFWGGPSGSIHPTFQTIYINYVPSISTRELDLKSAALSGQAMAVDIPNTNLFDVANRDDWLDNSTLVSIIPGVTLYGPCCGFTADDNTFDTNVTNQFTGQYYAFQPFADLRLRLAFADSVNLTEIDQSTNYNMGTIGSQAFPADYPPQGVLTNFTLKYSYNLTAVQDLLLDAMMHPITQFTFSNGTIAPAGLFNNTFGCPALGPGGTCANPIPQTIPIVYYSGDGVDDAIMTQAAEVINNISSTYNMGLMVTVIPLPQGQMYTEGFSGHLYMYDAITGPDYPWSADLTTFIYAPGGLFPGSDGWNLTSIQNYYNQLLVANTNDNLTGVASSTNEIQELANQAVMYWWTFFPSEFFTITSSVGGFTVNQPSMAYPTFYFYYATLYPK